MSLAPFRAVIFDCDGVLVDSEMLGLRSLQQALQEVGVQRSITSLGRFSGRSHNETLAELEAESGMPLLAGQIERRMDECYVQLAESEGLRPCQGVPRLLLQLTACRIPFTLASSGPRRKVQFSLRYAGLASAFSRFVCGDEVARGKPAPDLYLAAAALIGVPPGDCLAVEDAPNGVRAARAAGMPVVAVATTFPASVLGEADVILESLSDFPLHLDGRPASWLDKLDEICGEPYEGKT
jgi:HAD superfamily hydrolase (TIGR01509 family)